ncbi:hypothetical protein V8C42DRAFT_336821 [Trichoderma barbatum]
MDEANNSEHHTPTVDEANGDKIDVVDFDDLDNLHTSVVSNISLKMENSEILWERRHLKSNKVRTHQCNDDTLMKFTKPLIGKYRNAFIMRIDSDSDRASLNLQQTGDIIPLSACPGCSIYDDKHDMSFELQLGKILHLPRPLTLQINTKCVIYLLWLFKLDDVAKQIENPGNK